jgi:hypothetical protein
VKHVEAVVEFKVAGTLVATRTVSLPCPPKGALTDEQLEGFVRQAALRVLPGLSVADREELRRALES